LIMLLAASIAAWIPARRAATIDALLAVKAS
jgi:ABC-type antimicrobial peptide transport system permease subunit